MFSAHVRAYLQRIAGSGSYAEWVERYDRIAADDVARLQSAASALDPKLTISIVMPVYNPPEHFLRRAIQSIRGQIFQNWELCIADDCSSAAHARPLLKQYASEDSRIKLCFRQDNGGIAEASNSALALATGDYVAFVDQDDEIPPHALLLVAQAICGSPHLDLIYTDEDKISARGRRFDPYFKPDWNPALILSQNFFSHLGVYRRSLIERAGGFRTAFNGSQDYDLLLRCSELTAADKIHHIPHVLYHWRAVPESTASSATAKPYATMAGHHAVQEALARRGIAGKVEITRHNYYQVNYAVPADLPQVSILIPTTFQAKLAERCVAKLLNATTFPRFEVLLLANESARDLARNFSPNDPRLKVLLYPDGPFNFARINNWGASRAGGSVLCFMNDDTEVITPDWLEQMVARLALAGVGAVGPMLYYPNGTIQHAGTILGSAGVADHAHRFYPRFTAGYFGRAALEQDFSCITATCAAISRKAFESVGGFDEQLAVAFNDLGLCIRLTQAGWRILWTPRVEFVHHESAKLGPPESPERRERFKQEERLVLERWASVLSSDRYYNPNLSLEPGSTFKLAFPPRADWRTAILGQTKRKSPADRG